MRRRDNQHFEKEIHCQYDWMWCLMFIWIFLFNTVFVNLNMLCSQNKIPKNALLWNQRKFKFLPIWRCKHQAKDGKTKIEQISAKPIHPQARFQPTLNGYLCVFFCVMGANICRWEQKKNNNVENRINIHKHRCLKTKLHCNGASGFRSLFLQCITQ